QENALSYMLVLRLVPLFPFFVVNLVPAFLGVKTSTYILATLFGIIPGTVVYATVGAGLGSVFDRGQTCTTAGILTPEIIAALIGLAILALLPVAYKKFKKRAG
ncbi:MAG: VTT domain-containing protein, partial [Minwuiales bacterium]|nr:VTT domain-containing protein [Minwuiales bacterium]